MLHAFIINTKDLHLSTSGSNPTLPLRMSANPSQKNGMPYGFVSVSGKVYNSTPDGMPALIAYKDGGAEIRSNFSVSAIKNARFIISGSCLLLSRRKLLPIESQLKIQPTKKLHRIGVGIMKDGLMLFIEQKCTVEDLQLAFQSYGAIDALMLAFDDVYLDYPRGGVKMGTQPVTVLEAVNFKELPHPIVVVDFGHGGSDPGASHFGLFEKDINLRGGKIVYEYLTTHYEGTFLLIRDKDSFVELQDRPKQANAVGAEYYLSLHVNSSDRENNGIGYESFIQDHTPRTAVNRQEEEIQQVMHTEVMKYLSPLGVFDRGMKRANLCVLRESNCPAILVENLFINNIKDATLLKDKTFIQGLYTATAKGFAKAIGLKPKATIDEIESDGKLYRVQVGAFQFRKGAELTLEKLKDAGFEGFITRE